jgi:anaerobic ribonucleoside-triphosphate reductase activating protein
MKLSFPIQASFLDYPNNLSIALCVYLYGCEHNCDGCHSIDLQDDDYGKKITYVELYEMVKVLSDKNKTNKIVFMGGDPFYKKNFKDVNSFIDKYGDEFDICVYTGYNLEYLLKMNISNKFKFIKCGKFNKKLYQIPYKDDNKIVFASKNQILYNNKFEELSINGVLYFNK